MNNQYDDIIHQDHHISKRHPPMSMNARAAQFAPFAALTGYEEALKKVRARHEAEHERSDIEEIK